MKQTLTEIFLKHGQPSPDWDDAKKAAFKADMDVYEAELREAAKPKASTPPEKDATVTLSQEAEGRFSKIESAVDKMAAAVEKVVTHVGNVERQQQLTAEQQQQKRYTDHVGELLRVGKVSKADHDKLLTPDEQKKNLAALDVFIESSSRWGTIAGFKPEKPDDRRQQQSPQPEVTPGGQLVNMTALKSAAAEEIAEQLKS